MKLVANPSGEKVKDAVLNLFASKGSRGQAGAIESYVNSIAESKLGFSLTTRSNLGNVNNLVCGDVEKYYYNCLQRASSGNRND